MAAINEKGGEPVLCMWPRLDHHFADPPQMAIEAARGADAIFALTTTALSDASAGSRAMRNCAAGHVFDGGDDRRDPYRRRRQSGPQGGRGNFRFGAACRRGLRPRQAECISSPIGARI